MVTNKKKSMKLPGAEQVKEYLNNLEHPLKNEIEEVRRIILSCNKEITEHIKWNAPSFCFKDEDRITFNLHGKGYFQIIFHCGAKVKDKKSKEPLFYDTSGLLKWVDNDRAIVKLVNMDDINDKKEKLAEVVVKWIEVTSL
ncbi:DUF1801 domain-containing protein [Clostridium sp. AL.422]|uniref:DUF1801 domain-containing protein n=1 Tax=Clostridium TaxID=1485 RepID=UPI00293DC59F|nr:MULTISPECIES: DUF1801 domain-containing protein [unclassified Clostridium]MDV4151311.1 DUF1801 domain-containing protein [Clostridium sp. AL.422]